MKIGRGTLYIAPHGKLVGRQALLTELQPASIQSINTPTVPHTQTSHVTHPSNLRIFTIDSLFIIKTIFRDGSGHPLPSVCSLTVLHICDQSTRMWSSTGTSRLPGKCFLSVLYPQKIYAIPQNILDAVLSFNNLDCVSIALNSNMCYGSE